MSAERQPASLARAAMLAALGHDLRAPSARLLRHAQDGSAPLQRGTVAACAGRQLELIDDLLEFSRIERRPPELVAAPVYLYGLLQQMREDGDELARWHSGQFACAADAAGRPLPALAVLDARRLRQALRKLLCNALLRGDTALLRVDAAPLQGGGVALHFAIDDGGAALEPAELDGLDDPFRCGAEGSAALSVALAAHLARAMGGQLSAVNLEGGGSRHQFTLRAALAGAEDAAPPAPAACAVAPFGQGRSVLLLERNEAMRDYLTEIAVIAEFDVFSANSVRQLLELAAAQPPGRVPLVVAADGMSGIDIWQLLAGLEGSGVPVLLHASLPPQRPPGLAGAAGFACVLYKPAPAAALLQALRAMLQPA